MRLKYIIYCFLSLALLKSENSFAQSRQQQKTDSVLNIVRLLLGYKDAEGLYALTGDQFRKALSPEAFKAVAEQQLFPLGKMSQYTLTSFLNNKTATYKAQFELLTMDVLLSLDDKGKIDLFYFRPFKIEPIDKLTDVPTSNPMKTVQDKKVDTAARKYIQKLNTEGLSIGIIKNGQVSLYNYGETAFEDKQLPSPETIYEIGSITKTFTATLLAWYVNEGKIKLSDPIIKYLPDSVAANPALKQVTILELANHTSGLPTIPANLTAQDNYNKLNPYKNYDRKLLFAYLKTCTLDNKPGEKYVYSNLAVGLLGIILEKISGKTFEQMTREVICGPLDMKSTYQHLYPMLFPRFVPVHNEDGQLTPAWELDALAAAGALRSNVADLVLYAKANLNDNGAGPLSKAIKLTHEITFKGEPKIGLAWHIIVVNGVNYYYHNGGTYGSSSFLAFNKEKKLAVIVLSNAAASTDALGVDIIKKLQ